MSDNEDIKATEEDAEPATIGTYHQHNGISVWAIVISTTALSLALFAETYGRSHESAACSATDSQVMASAAASKAQAEYGTSIQKRIADLQVTVAAACVKAGDLPVFINGNVDCKAVK